ncbi:unnamed protein product [Durusdinium trenchii]|uniref:Uncharacterized protein n=3 Tax=Durusdinium trenchii TaxID=1381693 RepID=A0ABP0RWT0_9DINO
MESFFRPQLWKTENMPVPVPPQFQDLMQVAAELEVRRQRGTLSGNTSSRHTSSSSSKVFKASGSCTCQRRHRGKLSCAANQRRLRTQHWRRLVEEPKIPAEIRHFLAQNPQVTSLAGLREALAADEKAGLQQVKLFRSIIERFTGPEKMRSDEFRCDLSLLASREIAALRPA